MTRQVLGIAGRKQSGKTTLAKALEERGWVRISFADEVKELALVLDPWVASHYAIPPDRLSDVVHETGWDSAKREYPEVRRILQVVGTEIGRAIDPQIWVNKLANRIYRLPADAKVVIDDVRFINECNFIRHTLGGFVVRLADGDQDDSHQSEAEVDRLDPTLEVPAYGDWSEERHIHEAILSVLGWE